MKILILLSLMLNSFYSMAQHDLGESILDEENLIIEEGSLESELIGNQADEVAPPFEAERQEDILYPENEDSAWNLASDEIISEEAN